MDILNTVTSGLTTAYEGAKDAASAAVEYGESAIESGVQAASDALDSVTLTTDDVIDATNSTLQFVEDLELVDKTIRSDINEVIDDIAKSNSKLGASLKNAVQSGVTEVAGKYHIKETGKLTNKMIEAVATMTETVGQAITGSVKKGVNDFVSGQMNIDTRKGLHEINDFFVENKTVNKICHEAIEYDFDTVRTAFRQGLVGIIGATVAHIVSNDPFPSSEDLGLNETKIVNFNGSAEVFVKVGGGISLGDKMEVSKIGPDSFLIALETSMGGKVGLGAKVTGVGVEASFGGKIADSMQLVVDGKTLNKIKENKKNDEPLLSTLLKGNGYAEGIKSFTILGEGSAEIQADLEIIKAETELSVHNGQQWTAEGGWLPVFGAALRTSISAGEDNGFTSKDVGLAKIDGNLEHKVSLIGNNVIFSAKGTGKLGGIHEVEVSGSTRIDISSLNLTKEKIGEMILKNQIHPSDFGIQVELEASHVSIKSGGSIHSPIANFTSKIVTKTAIQQWDSNNATFFPLTNTPIMQKHTLLRQ